MKKNKSKKKLIVLGCSITHHAPGWAACLSKIIDMPLLNLAESSGSNALQRYRLQENLFNNRITSDDIIIWQITGSTRRYKRMEDNVNSRDILIKDNSLETQSSIITSKNIFDKQHRIDLVSHSLHVQTNTMLDVEQELENLLFYIIAAKKITPNTFVVYGWDTVMPIRYKQIFSQQLANHDIKIFTQSIVNWCSEKKLEFHPDNVHPKSESYQQYVNDYMHPQLMSFLK
jgi:hypothetical protein